MNKKEYRNQSIDIQERLLEVREFEAALFRERNHIEKSRAAINREEFKNDLKELLRVIYEEVVSNHKKSEENV